MVVCEHRPSVLQGTGHDVQGANGDSLSCSRLKMTLSLEERNQRKRRVFSQQLRCVTLREVRQAPSRGAQRYEVHLYRCGVLVYQ